MGLRGMHARERANNLDWPQSLVCTLTWRIISCAVLSRLPRAPGSPRDACATVDRGLLVVLVNLAQAFGAELSARRGVVHFGSMAE